MHSFFQSSLRKDIKTIVYGEQSFTINLFDQEYFGIIKKKSVWPLSLSWCQVLGVEIPFHNPQRINQEIQKIHKDFNTSRRHLFFQRGITNEIVRFDNISNRSNTFGEGVKNTRLNINEQFKTNHNLIPSFRENMPLATVVIDTTKSDQDLLWEMNSGAKDHIRKASKKWLEFRKAIPQDYLTFYEERSKIASMKWFHIISQHTFIRLMDYLHLTKSGDIFMAIKDGVILWWSIAVYTGDTITYLYGFSNRNEQYRNIWVHQFIKFQMFQRARENNLNSMDLFGGAPTGFPNHVLSSVSAFKESLWGQKIERYGNFDIVFNYPLYHTFSYYHQRKKS